MTTGERIKLALTSRRMEKYLTRMFKNRVPVFDYKVHLRGEKSFLDIYRDDWRLFMTPSRLQYEPHDITDEHAKPWLNEKCTMIDNALNVYTRLQNVFRAQVMNLHVYLDEIEPTPIPKIINHPCVANMTGVHIYGGTVQRCDLDAVMEWKQENAIQFITVGSDNIPSDYRHPN
uniref:Amidohydro-rel domain-containing protein n=1 Tax=Caenorhabditis tropicalis TaxID=1561998 RepID=A0A1I7T485_9PELO